MKLFYVDIMGVFTSIGTKRQLEKNGKKWKKKTVECDFHKD